MSPERPPSTSPTPPRRKWPIYALCFALIVGFVVVILVKACPPVPVPAGKPAPVEAPVDVKAAPVPEDSKAAAPVAASPAPIVVDVPAAKAGDK